MFGQRKLLRQVAAYTLLLWLFALTTGIANSCIVEPGFRHAAIAAAHDHHCAEVGSAKLAVGELAHPHQSPHADMAACAKCCDAASTSPPTVKQQADLSWVVALALQSTPALAVWPVFEPVGSLRIEPGLARARVPISIAFLRLTL